ncbi:MAG: ABC transporter permease [Acidimicrobiales bacterium]
MATVTVPRTEPRARRARRGPGSRSRLAGWNLFWLVIALAYFLVPIYSLIQFSFEGGAHGHAAGFHWFLTVFDDPQFRSSFWLSVQLAFETVVVSNLLLVPTAFWIHLRLPRLRPVMDLVSVLPFVVPPIVLIVGIIPFLQPVTWLYSRPEVLPFIYVVFAMPFLYRSLDAGLRAIDLKTLSEAAAGLGASTFGTLWRVVLPNLRAAVIGGSLLTVAIGMGEFTIASLLSFNTFPVYIFYIGQTTAYEAAALSVISLLLTWGLMLALFFFARGGRTTTEMGATR